MAKFTAKIVGAILITQIVACGSLTTVTKSNAAIGYDLKRHRTLCASTTRIYSGVTYDFCRFHAQPTGEFFNFFKTGLFIVDMAFLSPVLDTVLLPVTVVQQVKYGNPDVQNPGR